MGCWKYSKRTPLWCFYGLMLWVFSVSVHGTTPSTEGFINIDCGRERNTTYVQYSTGLTYVSDEQYIDTGVNRNVSAVLVAKEYYTLRSFPVGYKNCYHLTPVTSGSKYLVRASFYYANYDRLGKPPSFDLYFGVNFWDTVEIGSSLDDGKAYINELIAVAPADYIDVCLVNTGHGTPFISLLELRPLNDSMYPMVNTLRYISTFSRNNVGSNYTTSLLRYPNDAYDRLWVMQNEALWTPISINATINSSSDFEVPSLVMQTAAIPSVANGSIDVSWSTSNSSTNFLVVLHYAELLRRENNSFNEFNIYLNGLQVFADPILIQYGTTGYAYMMKKGFTNYTVSLKSTPRATLPPILSAWELYSVLQVISLPTYYADISAMNLIKKSYNISKSWSGDPCLPADYAWTGVNCKLDISGVPRITVLNLSTNGLTGEIILEFGNLTELEQLDLSHNNLLGTIPSSFDQLTALKFLYLSDNEGLLLTLPPGLQMRKNKGLLTVNGSGSVQKTKKDSKALVIGTVVGLAVLLIVGGVGLFFFYGKTFKNTTSIDPAVAGITKIFSSSELRTITKNFSEKIGAGGFGEVFRGCLENGVEVAVKVPSELSSQGIRQLKNEVEKLTRIHHRNLVSLIGYCIDNNCIALVYEYIQQGNLQNCLKGYNWSLPWKQRLRIAYESAQGLDYLHTMCNPPLIHRDVKTSNILLTTNLEAKISDFGLVRAFTGSHVTTEVVGTPGYLDPFYASCQQLNEKSDVYSFGVVLLEIITGKSPIIQGRQHITKVVQQNISKGNIESILDQNMQGTYNLNSIWKVTELALSCTSNEPSNRPDMAVVVSVLKDCLSLETSSSEISRVNPEIVRHNRGDNHVGGSMHSRNVELTNIGFQLIPDSGPSIR